MKDLKEFLKQEYPFLYNVARSGYKEIKLNLQKVSRIPKKIFSQPKGLIDKILIDNYPMIYSTMVSEDHLRVVLSNLYNTLEQKVEGDVVELGCNVGTTSMFIRKLLDEYGSDKEFHVYDSWEGLPAPSEKDNPRNFKGNFKKGDCKTQKEIFIHNFKKAKLLCPKIHSGWFSKIPDNQYPDKIAFAFFDGDFYQSIMDSFEKVYPRLTFGARITIHDYEAKFKDLQGVKKACDDFLEDKPEKGTIVNVEDYNVGRMIKR